MATYNKFENFVEDMWKGVHDFRAAGDTLKVMLTNVAPSATDTVKADLTEISAGFGYTAGGEDVSNDISETGGTLTLTASDVTWTASGGSIGPFRYVVLYNDTPVSPADPLIAWWDYGSSITLADGESFRWDVGASVHTVT